MQGYKPNFRSGKRPGQRPSGRSGFKSSFRSGPRPGGGFSRSYDSRYTSKDNWSHRYNKNHYIKSTQVRLIDSTGENVGIVETPTALRMAQDEGLDLIEVSPNSQPPVCRIMSWSKFLYEQKKKEKETRKNKQKELKELRFGTFIAVGDRERQLKRARDFLSEGHNVRITVTKRGRVPVQESKKLIRELLTALSEYSTIDGEPSVMGNRVSCVIKGDIAKPKSSTKADAKTQDKQNSNQEVSPDKAPGR